jgi:hypothetical protein
MAKRLSVEERDLYPGAVRNVAVDCTGVLDVGETITGSSTATDASGDLTVDQVQASSAALRIGAHSVPAGKAIQFRVSRNSAPDGRYEIDVVLVTSSGQRIPCAAVLQCV